jgi:hypothetical protein
MTCDWTKYYLDYFSGSANHILYFVFECLHQFKCRNKFYLNWWRHSNTK